MWGYLQALDDNCQPSSRHRLTGQAHTGLQECINYIELKNAPHDVPAPGLACQVCAFHSSWIHFPAITQLCQAVHQANQSDSSVAETSHMDNRKWVEPEPDCPPWAAIPRRQMQSERSHHTLIKPLALPYLPAGAALTPDLWGTDGRHLWIKVSGWTFGASSNTAVFCQLSINMFSRPLAFVENDSNLFFFSKGQFTVSDLKGWSLPFYCWSKRTRLTFIGLFLFLKIFEYLRCCFSKIVLKREKDIYFICH